MVYKYWDSITKEDLEFSVGSKSMVWDSSNNQPLLNDSDYNRWIIRGWMSINDYTTTWIHLILSKYNHQWLSLFIDDLSTLVMNRHSHESNLSYFRTESRETLCGWTICVTLFYISYDRCSTLVSDQKVKHKHTSMTH